MCGRFDRPRPGGRCVRDRIPMIFGRKPSRASEAWRKNGPDAWVVTGAPRPGTEVAVEELDRGGGDAASIVAVDPSFAQASFVAWTQTVYDRASAAWKAYDPEPLRAVMDAPVWDAYATHLLATGALSIVRN